MQLFKIKCFEVTVERDHSTINKHFNEFESYTEQSRYLGGLTLVPVKRHRTRRADDEDTDYHSSYKYKVTILYFVKICNFYLIFCFQGSSSVRKRDKRDTTQSCLCMDTPLNAFKTFNKRFLLMGTLLNMLEVFIPIDQTAYHKKQVMQFTKHIQSSKGRQSHYSLHKCKKQTFQMILMCLKIYTQKK